MNALQKFTVYVLYATLGTYAVPSFRVGGEVGLPYAVMIAVVLLVITGWELLATTRVPYVPRWIVLGVLGYVASIWISLIPAYAPDEVLSLKATLFVCSALLVAVSIKEAATLRRAVALVTVSGLAVFVYGIYGYVTGEVGDPIQHTFGYFGVTYLESTRNSDVLYVQTCFWAFLGLYLYAKSTRAKVLWFVGTIACAGAIVMSLARGAWVSTTVALSVVLWRSGAVRPRVLATTCALGTAGLVIAGVGVYVAGGGLGSAHLGSEWSAADAGAAIAQRFQTLFTLSTDGGNSNETRLELLSRSLEVGLAHPLGVGVGNARYFLTGISGLFDVNHSENQYVQIFVEQGWLGVVAFAILMAGIVLEAIGRAREAHPGVRYAWMRWALAGVAVDWAIYALFNVLVDNTWFWLVMALVIAWLSLERGAAVRHDSRIRSAVAPLGAAVAGPGVRAEVE